MGPAGVTPEVPWPVGLVAAVVAGILLWWVTGRLRLRPDSRAASTALYACGALLVEANVAGGVDGRATLLLALGGVFATAGRRRSALAAAACLGAVVLAPVVGVGVLVLLGGMALRKDLLTRFPAPLRRLTGAAGLAAAVAVGALLARPAADPALPPTVLAALLAAAAVVGAPLWIRLAWLRPPVAAVAALAVCTGVPGPDADAVLPLAAGIAVLTAVLAEEHRALFARPALVAATMGVVVAGAVGLAAVVPPAAPPAPVAAVAPARPRPAVPAVRPVSIAIPAIGVQGPLAELIVADDGELLAPDDPGRAGWYAEGVVPGDVGPAVIGGHVDSRRGPGVFFALRRLAPDDVVEITRSDGSVARFTVTDVRQVAKSAFPTDAVYAPTPRPELRLVTCGGRFDRASRNYQDNVVVEAVRTQ